MNPTPRILLPVAFGLALALACLAAPAARAGDEDAGALLRRARTAETVDRDVAAAMDLYRKAVDAAGDADASRDAALALARLQEARGLASEALATLGLATERFASRMDEPTKREVHESMVRLLPPGSTARSPLGQVFVVGASPAPASTSPLDGKIRDLLASVDDADPNQQWSVHQQVRQALAAVGKEALPALERFLYSERPSRADRAAAMLASIGGSDALPALERAIRTGDGFTRSAALKALASVPKGEAEDARVAEAVDRLLREEGMAAHKSLLQDLLRWRLPPAELLARHRAGGPDAGAWLRWALQRKAEGALERAMELARGGGEQGREALEALLPLVFTQDPKQQVYPPETLDAASRRAFLDLLLAGTGTTEPSLDTIALLLAGLPAEGPSVATEADRERAWRLAAAPQDVRARRGRVRSLLMHRVALPNALLGDPEWSAAFLKAADLGGYPAEIARLAGIPEFWDALLRSGAPVPWEVLQGWLQWLQNHYNSTRTLPPASHDARWIPLLRERPLAIGYPFVAAAAVRSGDPAFLDLVRAQTRGAGWPQESAVWLQALRGGYRGPRLLELAVDLLGDPNLPPYFLRQVFAILAEGTGPEGRQAVLAIARDWKHPQAVWALGQVGAATDADLLEIARQVQAATPTPNPDYRGALILALQNRRLREAVPYLVWEFQREERSAMAGKALDAIRDYHEKITAYEAWAKGGPAPNATADLLGLLAGPDAEVRRAAAIALGALRRKDALPALVKAGAEDADERVRKAALEAVERIGRE